MVSKAGKAVRLVDRINSKLRAKKSPSAFNRCVEGKMGGMKGKKSSEIRDSFKKAAKACRGTTGK